MTNEEYLKSYTGKEFINCINRYFVKNDLFPYIDWERWLANERSAFFFKGVAGVYTQRDGSKIQCTVVDQVDIVGLDAYKIVIFQNGKYYLITVSKDEVKCKNTL